MMHRYWKKFQDWNIRIKFNYPLYQKSNASSSNYDKTRYAPYYQRYYQSAWNLPPSTLNNSLVSQATDEHNQSYVGGLNDAERIQDGSVVLQISNLDPWYDEQTLRNYLLSQLKPITPVYSLTIEGPNLGKVKVPSQQVNSCVYNVKWVFFSMTKKL